jgi:mediator of replication checkpoint protein 1
MAEFDSDSEDDTRISKSTTAVSKLNLHDSGSAKTSQPALSHDSDSESEDDVAKPKGRMASRMQGNTSKSPETKDNSAFARVSKALRSEKEQAHKPEQAKPEPTLNESSDDDLPAAGPRRKNKARSKSSESETNQTPPRSESPLFVSSPSKPDAQSDDDNGATEKPKGNARFLSLVAQKRKEREEREKAEAEKKAARRAQMEHFSSEVISGEESGADDPGSAHKLSQKARQPRKASKKALDEMRQETQRMSRNMQLAHQAQTKKKITKESLFAKFNFMQPDAPTEQPVADSSSTNHSQNSEGEVRTHNKDTPHTSPARPSDPVKATIDSEKSQADVDMVSDDEDLLDPQNLFTQEGRAAATAAAALKPPLPKAASPKAGTAKSNQASRPDAGRPFRVRISRQQIAERQKRQDSDDDSDGELEIVTSPGKCRRLAAFENLPTRQMQEDPAMTKLKALAHLTSPSRKGSSMNAAELSASLLRRARQQAAKERKERIEELKAKGVVIETAEERAAMEDDMENLVEKARKEADEIARLERAAKKKGNADDDDEDDGDYNLSGSDEEGYGEGDDEDEEENDSIDGGDLVEREADDDDDDDESEGIRSDAEEVPSARRTRPTRVISDDEDEDQPQPPSTPVRAPSHIPQSTERPKFPGMGTPGEMSLGLTQAFASTLDNVASQPPSSTIPFSLPDPGRPMPHLRKEESEILVPDSQPQPQEKDLVGGYTQSVTRVSESPAPYAFSEYSQSQLPDPTQDEGFVFSPFDPAKRFRDTPPISTVDTVLVGQTQSPIADRKRKMLRRGRANELPQVDEKEDEFEINADAFNVMKKAKAAKKQGVEYDKKNSKAKDIVDEAAEESEDEYAGLGGRSDESDGEENAIDRQMINDNSGEVVDEKQLAALNACVFPIPLERQHLTSTVCMIVTVTKRMLQS